MIDIETLATTTDAVVLTIGACKFDPYTLTPPTDGFYVRLEAEMQTHMGRKMCNDTLEWWSKQPKHIQEEALGEGNRTPVAKALIDLRKWMNIDNNTYVWSQGNFDLPILKSLAEDMGRPIAIHYWQILDSRSIMTLFGKRAQSTHNALEDCLGQVQIIQDICQSHPPTFLDLYSKDDLT